MNPQKNQGDVAPQLLHDLQSEVSEESAHLLQFIVRYAPAIASIVLALLLALGGMAIWKWYHGGRQDEAMAEVGRIGSALQGSERDAALEKLAKEAPEDSRLFIYMTLGQSAQENGNPVLAARAYASATELDRNGALGLAAAINGAGSLLMQNEGGQALALLQEIEGRLPEVTQAPGFRQMLAEAALMAGQKQTALVAYRALGQADGPEGAYFRARAAAIEKETGGKTP